MDSKPLMQTMLWTCSNCGFVIDGSSPHKECPFCEASKSSFIDTPQHIEFALRKKFKEFNTDKARKARLTQLREGKFLNSARVRGHRSKVVYHAGYSRTDR